MATASIRLDQDLVEKATIMGKALKQAIIAKAEKEVGKLEEYDFG